MNSKSILKRTMPLIVALAIIIIIAVSCTLFVKDKKVPQISNPDEVFLEAGDIVISNQEMYENLKRQMGIGNLVTLLDKYLLTEFADNNYYAAVTQEEIDAAIEEEIFPNGRSDDEEKDQEAIENWEDQMFLYGYINDEKINERYRIIVAQKKYAKDQILADYEASLADEDEDDLITEKAIKDYYEANYIKSFWTIVVDFESTLVAEAALAQIGIVVDKVADEDGKEVDTWVWGQTGEALTEEQVKQAFIDLFNNRNAYRAIGYPNADPKDNLVVREGVHYEIVDGKIIFNTTAEEEAANNYQNNKNLFYFSYDELDDIDKNLGDFVDDLAAYNAENRKLYDTFTVKPQEWTSSSKSFYVLKIAFEDPAELEDVEEEIIDVLLEELYTNNSEVSKIFAKLRTEANLVIYDETLEAAYITNHDRDHKLTKAESDKIIASVDGKEFTADELFTSLKEQYGVLSSLDLYNYQFLLYSDYNKIYKYKGRGVDGEVLDADKWRDINEQIKLTKQNFSANAFAQQGFPSSYGWNNFLRDFYIRNYGFRVENEEDLKMFFLYQEVTDEFKKQISETTDELWEEVYLPHMNKQNDEFFSVDGVHLLITIKGEDGSPINPEEWDQYHIDAAEELYDYVQNELRQEIAREKRAYLETKIIREYNNTPRFIADYVQDASAQPFPTWDNEKWNELIPREGSYLLSKYKSAGIEIEFQNLNTINPGQMVEPFENAVREIWEEAERNGTFGENVVVYDKSYNQEYLASEFGYHILLTTRTRPRPTATEDGEEITLYVPSRELVDRYEEFQDNDLESDLSRVEERSIQHFYSPIRQELRGNNYSQLQLMLLAMDNIDNINYKATGVNDANQLERTINLYIDSAYKSLKYINNPNEG